MDTATHLLIGLGLGAMAHLSPEVAANPSLGLAITIGTVIASEAPDLDILYKIKGTSAYLKNHRRWTHSIPAWFIWPSLITFGLSCIFHGLPWGLIWLWCLAAVLIHVATDTLNTFGAIPLLPFSDRRLSYDVLQVFDPVLFVSQLSGIVLWCTGIAAPGPLFLFINTFAVIYIAVKCLFRRQAAKTALGVIRDLADARFSIMPTFRIAVWKAVIETAEGFYLGTIRYGRFEEEMRLMRDESGRADLEPFIKQSDVYHTFCLISEHIYYEAEAQGSRTRLVLTDLRYRYRHYFLSRAVFELDDDGLIVSERLCKKSDMGMRIGVQKPSGYLSASS